MNMVTDPICKMIIDEKKAAGKSDYNGKTYYFCEFRARINSIVIRQSIPRKMGQFILLWTIIIKG